ncbi:MAG: ABC transporter substrate-binding protein [Rhodobacteraceae bacterium]|nr:ABC transporter substrate-binding protein [Paracoccaceae bacterium]
MTKLRGATLVSTLALAAALGAPASADVVIGYLAAMTGAASDMTGESALHAVQMAIDDFGGTVNGEPIRVLSADHAGQPDTGLAIARQWVDEEHVNLLLNVDNSAVALAVSDLIRDRDVSMMMGASSTRLIGESCGPHQTMMLLDSGTLARAVVAPQVAAGANSWYFITVDYALGHDLQAQAQATIEAGGGQVLGESVHSFQTSDFSAFLLQAQSSGATNIALATFGSWQNTIVRQAAEFGVSQALSPFYLAITDIHSAGLENYQNVTGTTIFYWDLNDGTRAFAQRFMEGYPRPPTFPNAYHYEMTRHYLRAVEAVGSTNADAVNEWMRAHPVENVDGNTATIRADGATVRTVYPFRTKTVAESTGEWDLLEILGAVDGETVVGPLADSTCPLVHG